MDYFDTKEEARSIMNPKKFTATTSWSKSMAGLPGKTRLEVYDALFHFVETGQEPEMTPEAKAAFAFIRTDLEMEIDKTIALCEKRRESVMKRWHREDTGADPREEKSSGKRAGEC